MKIALMAVVLAVAVSGCAGPFPAPAGTIISSLGDWELGSAPNFNNCQATAAATPENPLCTCDPCMAPSPEIEGRGSNSDCDQGEFLVRYSFTLSDSRFDGEPPLNRTAFTVWTNWQMSGVLPTDEVARQFPEQPTVVNGTTISELLPQTPLFALGLPNEYNGVTNSNGVGEFALLVVSMPLQDAAAETCPPDLSYPDSFTSQFGDIVVCVEAGGSTECSTITGVGN